MKRGRPCPRIWEAEAIEDGRLDSTARASFERHAATCDACRGELLTLARIAETMNDLPQHEDPPLDRRRARVALLQRANEHLMRGRAKQVRTGSLAVALACVLAAAFVASRAVIASRASARPVATASASTASVGAPVFEIVEVGQAAWTKTIEGSIAHVALIRGIAAIHVEHLAREQRFLVDLPDGDLEVRGTRFQVSVLGGRTAHVEVTEGVVALRLRGTPEVVLRAGGVWNAPVEPATSTPLASTPMKRQPDAPSRVAAAVSSSRMAPASDSEDTPATALSAGGPAPADDGFAAAIHRFEGGQFAEAGPLLASFERDHPHDARSEDAAFLRAVCRAKMGDRAGASRLSREYLQRYPHGLRRPEAERMVTGD